MTTSHNANANGEKSTFTLTVRETGNKAGKFHYQILDAAGNVRAERKSNRVYVAATICGGYFFGRIDLIGKGDHGRNLKFCEQQSQISEIDFAKTYYAKNNLKTIDEYREGHRRAADHQKQIAHLQQ